MRGMRWGIGLLLVLVSLLTVACSGGDKPAATGGESKNTTGSGTQTGSEKPTGPQAGGELYIASDEAPPTLDPHRSGVTATTVVALHIYEGLYTMNAKDQPIPMLAEGADLSADGKVYSIRLRKGIKFHNGKEMTAEDVVASLKRWGQVAGSGKTFFKNVASLEAVDAHTVRLTVTQPSGVILTSLGTPNQAAAILPKEIVDGADPKEGIKEYIGTGPYRFVEHIPDQHLKLTRFDGYQPVDAAADGLGGKKVAYADALYFVTVTDPSIRVAGTETGQYQFADFIPSDEYPRLKDSTKLDAVVTPARGWDADVFNLKGGIMTTQKIRQAWLAALDVEEVSASQGQMEFYRFDPSIILKETAYHSTRGADLYNQKNPARARQLLQEAGYSGTPIRWMVSTSKQNFALAAKQQLEAAGFVIDLQVMEWATVVQRRSNPELWDVFSTGYTMRPEPTDMAFLSCSGLPGWCDQNVQDLVLKIRVESDFTKRFALWEEIQTAFYDQVPIVKYGDYGNLRVKSTQLEGYANHAFPFFWNTWLKK